MKHRFAVGLTTIQRNDFLALGLQAIRMRLPEVTIYVADQNGNKLNAELYSTMGVTPLWLEWDAGLSKARNEIFRAAEEDYILLIDDDDVLSETCDEGLINDLCELLDANPDWLVIGGRLEERSYHHTITRDSNDPSILILHQSVAAMTAQHNDAEYSLIESDTVMNFAVFSRHRLINWELFWDESLKIHEHLDFYLSVQKFRSVSGKARVFHCDDLSARSLPGPRSTEYSRNRFRSDYLNIAARKWGITEIRTVTPTGQTSQWMLRDTLWADALTSIAEVLSSNGVPWWISNGTLLGLIREGNFIAHDNDMDVTVLVSPHQTRKLEKAFRRAGFRILRAWGYPGSSLEWALKAPTPPDSEWPFGPIKVDIFFAEESKHGLRVAGYRGNEMRWLGYPPFSVTERFVEAWGARVNVPEEAEKLLELEYGKTWRRPAENWDYWTSPSNIVAGPVTVKRLRPALYRFSLYLRWDDFVSFIERTPRPRIIRQIFRALGLRRRMLEKVGILRPRR